MQWQRASCRASRNCQQRRTLPVTWRWTSSKRRGRCREIWFAVAMRGRKISTKSVSSLCKTPRKSDQPSPRTGAPSMTVPPYRRRVSGGCYRCRVGNWGERRRRETAADSRRFMFLPQTHTELHFFLHWLVVLADVLHPVGELRWRHPLGWRRTRKPWVNERRDCLTASTTSHWSLRILKKGAGLRREQGADVTNGVLCSLKRKRPPGCRVSDH